MPPVPSTYRQEAPFALQVELVEGCNLRCSFCGLNGIRGKENNFKFMSDEMVAMVVDRLEEAEWHPRMEFAMHGEPSQHPRLIACLDALSKTQCQMMMTSNGAGFMRNVGLVDDALEYLNILALDWYEGVMIVPKILEQYKGQHTPIRYPQDPTGNPHRRRKLTEHLFVIIQDIEKAEKGTHSHINNHAGAGAPKNSDGVGKRCAKPFREMSIRWDGSVAVCCNDWRGEYKCGNIADRSLEEIWNGAAFQSARRKLYHGIRDFGPCNGCDATSYRVGLLPDKKGLVNLPLPSAADERAIQAALAGPPLTLPVLRPWEMDEVKQVKPTSDAG